jgi:hypothetical protein
MKALKSFGLFWWDFIVGDDWRMAAGVIVLLGVSAFIAHHGIAAWWLPPVGVVGLLAYSLARAVRRR